MTFNSFTDWLKRRLRRSLWGYPHLVDIVFSKYADLRGEILEQRRTRLDEKEAAPAGFGKKTQLSLSPELSVELWAHAAAEDVTSEFTEQGPGCYVLFNPGLKRSLDVSLVHSLTHWRCVSFTSSMIYTMAYDLLQYNTVMRVACDSPRMVGI